MWLVYLVLGTVGLTICESDNVTMPNCNGKYDSTIELNKQNRLVKLICRDDTMLLIGIENRCGELEKIAEVSEAYQLKVIQFDKNKILSQRIYLMTKPIKKIENLQPNTTYKISATFLDKDHQYLAKDYYMEFETLKKDYIPGNVTSFHTGDFSLSADGKSLDVDVLWDPSADRTCANTLYVAHQNDVTVHKFNVTQALCRHHVRDLKFGTEYSIGIRASNTKNETLQSSILYKFIKTPSCLEWSKNNLSSCAPYKPENITVKTYRVTESRYKFKISWNNPPHNPDYYTVDINGCELNLRHVFHTNGKVNSIRSEDIEIIGSHFELIVSAHSSGGKSSTIYNGSIHQSKIYQKFIGESYNSQTLGFIIVLLSIIVLMTITIKCNIFKSSEKKEKFEKLDLLR